MSQAICSVADCESQARARGWCNKHWKRWKKHGSPNWEPTERICSVENCDRKHHAKGWCHLHHERHLLHGEMAPPNGPHYRTPAEAFEARTAPDGDCLMWTGTKSEAGYGEIKVGGRMVKAHRYAYEQAHGPIPEDAFIDHKCWNRACVNVDHLRVATPSENSAYLRGARDYSQTGVRGVYPNRGRFRGQVRSRGVLYDVGTFDTVAEAARAVEQKRLELFGEFAGPGSAPLEETP